MIPRKEDVLASLSLVTEPWIPVRTLEGRLVEVGLREVLLQANAYQRIEDASPLVVAALHRLLLAVAHRALLGPTNPEQAVEWWENGFPEGVINDYLTRWEDRFDLFNPEHPFYQVPDFTLELSSRSWTALAAELNSDNSKVLFDHTEVANPHSIKPAEAARLLVAHQTFALSAGKSVLAHTVTAPVATAALVLVVGDNLRETLCLNMVSKSSSVWEADKPVWELEPPTIEQMKKGPKQTASGLVQRYTWLTRSIHLEPEEEAGETAVRWMAYASGVRYESDGDLDPMVAYRKDDERGYLPIGFRRDRGFWRDFLALLPHQGHTSKYQSPQVVNRAVDLYRWSDRPKQPLRTWVLGQASVSGRAKIELWRSETFNLPTALLSDKETYGVIRWALEQAEQAGKMLNAAVQHLAASLLSAGNRQPLKSDVTKLVNSFPLYYPYWSNLEVRFSGLLARLTPDFSEEGVKAYWIKAVSDAAKFAWTKTIQSLGSDARALRAQASAQSRMDVYLAGLRRQVRVLEEEVA